MQHRRAFVLEIDLHQLRQRVEPRDAVVALKHRLAARLQDAVHLLHQAVARCRCTARRRARTRSRSDRRETAAPRRRRPAGGREGRDVRRSAAPARMAESAMSTPVARAPPRANRTRSTPVPQPTSSTRLARQPVKGHQAQQVMELVEVILVEIVEEPGRTRRMREIARSWMCSFQ